MFQKYARVHSIILALLSLTACVGTTSENNSNTPTTLTEEEPVGISTHSEDFYVYIYDYQGNKLNSSQFMYAIDTDENVTNYSIPSNQNPDREAPTCSSTSTGATSTNSMHCFWEVGRHGNSQAADFFNSTINDHYSVIGGKGDDNSNFQPAKPPSKLNFAWQSSWHVRFYQPEACSISGDIMPVTTMTIDYTLGQAGSNPIAVLFKDMVVNKVHDVLCAAAFEGTASNEDSPLCTVYSISDWSKTATSFIQAYENPWILATQVKTQFLIDDIDPTLAGGFYTDFTFDGTNPTNAMTTRLMVTRDSDNKKSPSTDDNHIVHFKSTARDMTSVDMVLSKYLSENLYTGENRVCP